MNANIHFARRVASHSPDASSVVFGIHPVEELILSGLRRIDRLYFDKDRPGSSLFELVKLARKQRLPYQMVPGVKLDELCRGANHQGALALCSAKEYTERRRASGIAGRKENTSAPLSPRLRGGPPEPGRAHPHVRCVRRGRRAARAEEHRARGPTVAKDVGRHARDGSLL